MAVSSFLKNILKISPTGRSAPWARPGKLSRAEKKEFIAGSLSPENKSGLEIGPNISPVFAKSEGFSVEYIESVNTAQLKKRCEATGKDPGRVEEIDFVFQRDAGLLESIGKKHCYDYVVSSHLVEHIPNLVGHFSDVSSLLNDEGMYGLIVPDKKLCFDFAKPPSTLGQVLEAHVHDHKSPTLAAYIDELRYGVRLHEKGAWALDETGTVSAKYEGYHASIEKLLAGIEEHDPSKNWFGHNWFFSCDSFVQIFDDLATLGLTDLQLIDVLPTGHMDFIIILAKKGASMQAMSLEQAMEKLDGMDYFADSDVQLPSQFRI